MYDISKRSKMAKRTVSDLIEYLEELPQDAEIVVCGESIFYAHIERDDSVVCLDTEDLDEEYIEDNETTPDEYWAYREID